MSETTVSARGSSRSVRYGPGECRPDAPGSVPEIGAGGRAVKGDRSAGELVKANLRRAVNPSVDFLKARRRDRRFALALFDDDERASA